MIPQSKYRLYDLNLKPSPNITNTNIKAMRRKRLTDNFKTSTLLLSFLFSAYVVKIIDPFLSYALATPSFAYLCCCFT